MKLQLGDKVRILPGADEWRRELGFVSHDLDGTTGTFPHPEGFQMASGQIVCLIEKYLEKIEDPPIGVWIWYDGSNPPKNIGYDVVLCGKNSSWYRDGTSITLEDLLYWDSCELMRYFYLPKPKERTLPKCGVCGGEVRVERINDIAPLWRVSCSLGSNHITVEALTEEEAISNYRKQRGEG